VKRFFRCLSFALVSALLSACTAEGIYEGSRAYNKVVWRHAQLPVGEGYAPVSISLGTWRRG
jgi:outer membrane biogenesis lipoprotein LolB